MSTITVVLPYSSPITHDQSHDLTGNSLDAIDRKSGNSQREQYNIDMDALRDEVYQYKYSKELQGKEKNIEESRGNDWFWHHTIIEHLGISISIINIPSDDVRSFIESEAFEKVLGDYNLSMKNVVIHPPL